MQKALWLSLLSAVSMGTLQAQEIVGDWHGTLQAGGTDLRLLLHITKGDNGALKATLDSVDQGANGISVTSTTLHASKLKLRTESLHGTYEGQVNTAPLS